MQLHAVVFFQKGTSELVESSYSSQSITKNCPEYVGTNHKCPICEHEQQRSDKSFHKRLNWTTSSEKSTPAENGSVIGL